MSNIEEDIKRCKKLTEPQNANWIGISNQLAIAHLIERIKELEEENVTLRKANNITKDLTKEQEVITYIKKRIKICNENADICDDNDFDEEATYLREESYMLETVLSMLKENSAEIEQKNTELAEKSAEIERLNRQIDLMAEQLAGLTIWDNEKEEPLILTDKEEVKQYFERKSKE